MTYSIPWLLEQITAGKTFEYIYFWGHRKKPDGIGASCLSQWYAAGFWHDEKHFYTAEHWMMYQKALLFGDQESADAVLSEPFARAVKAIGRKVKNYDDQVWAERKYPIVVEGNERKFSHSRKLREYLLSTGDAILVEASPYDTQWGIGMSPQDAEAIADPSKWQGTNLLGWALMEARDRLLNNDN